MLDPKTAKVVQQAISNYFGGREMFPIEATARMELIPATDDGYSVLAAQTGDVTILVWIQFKQDTNTIVVRNVKTQNW